MNDTFAMWLAKVLGAFAGSAFSLAFMAPASRREAMVRLACGIFVGTAFGGLAADWVEKQFGLSVGTDGERALTGAFIASFVAWYALGFAVRVIASARSTKDLEHGE